MRGVSAVLIVRLGKAGKRGAGKLLEPLKPGVNGGSCIMGVRLVVVDMSSVFRLLRTLGDDVRFSSSKLTAIAR